MSVLPESTWTAPRPDCPRPDRWHATDEMSTESEVTALVAAFAVALQPDYAVETGTCRGNTTEALGRALAANGHGELVSLEVDSGLAAMAATRCADLPVRVLHLSSLDWWPDRLVDFAWFDSDEETRVPEFRRYLPWMHAGTVVGFHDTGPHHRVRGFLSALEYEGLVRPLYLPTPRGVCFSRVAV